MKKGIVGVILVIALATSPAFAISVVNGSFEDGLSGWTKGPDTDASRTFTNGVAVSFNNNPYFPTDGDSLALLQAGSCDNDGSELWQNITALAGESLSFDWTFLAFDEGEYDDFSQFIVRDTVNNSLSEFTLASISTVGDFGETGWNTYKYTFESSFQGMIGFRSKNVMDSSFPSYLVIDNVRGTDLSGGGTAPVPEPGTMLLLGSGLVGLAGLGKKKKER